jgi:hypothetical protein
MSRITEFVATPSMRKNSPVTEISSPRLRCTAEKYPQMNVATPIANNNKSTMATSLRKGELKTTTASTVTTTNIAVSAAFNFTILMRLP